MPWVRRLPLASVALLACLTASCARRSTPTGPPPLYVVDDVVLGRRNDGTVDHVAAEGALGQLDPKRIESIEVIEEASNRFGPEGVNGVVIFTMIKDTSPSVPKAP